ncbi:hypothetical protein ZHAS_00020853 [Anopheles sinensis]|uniref:Uncharacterized protein n=1 Tax=Anopheles sinensis TaxID=74873 RepID=A0A084WQW0_ANOSI|nr:hypothetical protein ZHAS_00020853 [Anopheles sinensis]
MPTDPFGYTPRPRILQHKYTHFPRYPVVEGKLNPSNSKRSRRLRRVSGGFHRWKKGAGFGKGAGARQPHARSEMQHSQETGRPRDDDDSARRGETTKVQSRQKFCRVALNTGALFLAFPGGVCRWLARSPASSWSPLLGTRGFAQPADRMQEPKVYRAQHCVDAGKERQKARDFV